METFGAYSFSVQVAAKENSLEATYKCSHVIICISLKYTLRREQKSVYTVKILISEQKTLVAVLYFGQVFAFCRLINKSVLEWFLLTMRK